MTLDCYNVPRPGSLWHLKYLTLSSVRLVTKSCLMLPDLLMFMLLLVSKAILGEIPRLEK